MYNIVMQFEWDNSKSRANKEKHGIDFEASKNLWRDENRIEVQASHPIEDRNIIIGKINDKLYTGIYTVRGNNIRIISVRRARKKEAFLYEKEKNS